MRFVRMIRRPFVVAVALACVMAPTLAVHAAEPTATPAALAPPANPSDVRWDLASRTISWRDNSSDEAGFELVYTIGADNAGYSHRVAANVTSFVVPEDVNDTDRRVAHIVVMAFNDAGRSAGAVAEWNEGTPSPTVVATPTLVAMEVRLDDSGRLSWDTVAGASTYHLHGELDAVRVNARHKFCAPPVEPESLTVPIDETLPAGATSYAPPFPAIAAADRWFVYSASVQIEALDAAGSRIAGIGIGRTAETGCSSFEPIVAPNTGGGPSRGGAASLVLFAAIVGVLAGGAAVGAGVRMRTE
jgi:hypothetical protein